MSDGFQMISDDEEARWEELSTAFVEQICMKMSEADTAVFAALDGAVNLRFAAELGVAILMDKPIILVALPGAVVAGRLADLAQAVIQIDDLNEIYEPEFRERLQQLSTAIESCCCNYGLAIAGEWPENECSKCPRHGGSGFGSDFTCKRHRAEST